MAVIVRTRVRVEDAAGVPVSGGKFRVYLANTTTLATLYSDAALTVPLTNPVVAGSDGWCAEIFCAAANYDCATLTAADVVIKSEDDVPSLGSDGATFSKDFTNSRVQITGSGGVIRVEAGDASPDNTGGQGKLGGWNGTQADSWIADAALFDTTGRIKENGKKLIGVVQTDVTTFSTSTGLIIALDESPSDVREYLLDVWDLQAAGTVALTGQGSFDGGLNYKSGAADYTYVKWIVDNNTASPALVAQTSSGDTKIDIIYALRTAANRSARLRIKILTPESGNEHTILESEGVCCDRAGTTYLANFKTVAEVVGSYGRMTHLKMLQGANLISGKYRLTVIRGSGDA